ncbi:MAG: hypothetical protein JXA42_20540 [Anaerolineales bacterium]|nr:hypothetical protein [Anaerolineales bacterium]
MKKLSFLLVFVLLASMIIYMPVSGANISWTSGFQVQNLSDTEANIAVGYFNQDGTQAIPDVTDTIPPMDSKTYYPIDAASGFNGSVIVSSDQPVVAIANTLGNSPQYAASTEGFAGGADSIMLPLIMRGNAGYYTWFNVQNASGDDVNVTVEYVAGSSGNNYTADPVTIKPGAAATFSQHDISQLGTKFVGSAVVTSDSGPIVATVMQVGETYKNMMGYNGFTAGSTEVSLPLVMSNNSGYYTGIQVQNVGDQETTVTLDFGANIAGAFAPTDQQATLQPNESYTFLQNTGQFATAKFVGSATVSSTADQPVVAIVNQVKMTGVALGTAYNGFDPDAATDKVSAPLIMANNNGYYTGIQVMNVGDAATTITVSYGSNIAGTYSPGDETATLQPGASYNSIQSSGSWIGKKYVGSLSVEASAGGSIVMIVNEVWPAAAGDQFMTYGGFNY